MRLEHERRPTADARQRIVDTFGLDRLVTDIEQLYHDLLAAR